MATEHLSTEPTLRKGIHTYVRTHSLSRALSLPLLRKAAGPEEACKEKCKVNTQHEDNNNDRCAYTCASGETLSLITNAAQERDTSRNGCPSQRGLKICQRPKISPREIETRTSQTLALTDVRQAFSPSLLTISLPVLRRSG